MSQPKERMIERYTRAARLSAPRLAAQTPGIAVEGYWLDDESFYFLAERFELSIERILSTPSIAHVVEGRIEEIVSLDALADILSEQTEAGVDLAALADADFDMPSPDALAVTVGEKSYLIDRQSKRVLKAVTLSDIPTLYAPNGRYGCFVKGNDVWLQERESDVARALTTDGALHHSYGRQSETDMAAVSYRKRPTPVGLWSPDSQWFLTHRIDERSLPELALLQHAPPGGGRPVLHSYKYPMPGDDVPVAQYVAIHIPTGRVVTFHDVPVTVGATSPFSLRMAWFEGNNRAWILRQDRYCKHGELVSLDLANGRGMVVVEETVTSGHFDFHLFLGATPNVRTLSETGEVVWYSERDGWGHLYLYDAGSGALKNRITSGEWLVRDIVHIDATRRKIFFLAGGVDPTADRAQRSLCVANLDGGGFEVLIAEACDIAIPKTEPSGFDQDRPFRPSYAHSGFSANSRFVVARQASIDRGNRTEIVDVEAKRRVLLASALPAPGEITPRPFTVLAADGVTQLHGALFLPSDFDEVRRYPLIDYIYPGPQVPWKPQSFRSVQSGQARALAELGFATIMLDTRRTPVGSRAFHKSGYPDLLEPQLADHAAAVRQLCKQFPFIDGERAGIIGASGGGSATARALFDYGDVFKVGVAVCGNHDSTFYAAVWSDKYRGQGGQEDWNAQSNSTLAHKLTGKLLLISGDMDENVHVSQTLALADALVRANRDFDLLIVPNQGHGVLMASGYAQRRAWDYFVQHLLGETPPQFDLEYRPEELTRMVKRSLKFKFAN